MSVSPTEMFESSLEKSEPSHLLVAASMSLGEPLAAPLHLSEAQAAKLHQSSSCPSFLSVEGSKGGKQDASRSIATDASGGRLTQWANDLVSHLRRVER